MGRRFQVYYVYNGNDKIMKTGFHLQVCCGDDSICLLEQVLLFTKKYSEYPDLNVFLNSKSNYNNKSDILLENITGAIHRTGVFLFAKKLTDDICDDPLTADNDEGIFIVDLRSTKPRYCLMNYNFQIVTPNEYFKIYEDEYYPEDNIIKEIPNIINNINTFDTIPLKEIQYLFPTLIKR